jgi:hypothetical protein
MVRLPFIDEHRTHVDTTPERTWDAVVKLVRSRLARPAPALLAALWRLEPASGFAVAEEAAPHHLALRGHHRFSRYGPEPLARAAPARFGFAERGGGISRL